MPGWLYHFQAIQLVAVTSQSRQAMASGVAPEDGLALRSSGGNGNALDTKSEHLMTPLIHSCQGPPVTGLFA